MSDASTAGKISFTSVHPVLAVRDLEEEVAYYRDKLDFEVSWRWGEPPVRAGVSCGGLELQLVADGRFAPPSASNVYFLMQGVDAFYEGCVERGAEIHMPLDDRPFGMRDFRVTDLSGNRLGFGEAIV